jgi:hypothetical protein
MTEEIADRVATANPKKVLAFSANIYVIDYRDARDNYLTNSYHTALMITRSDIEAHYYLKHYSFLLEVRQSSLEERLGHSRIDCKSEVVILPSALAKYQQKIYG